MNIMKIVHNLRQLVVFSHRFKSISLPRQTQCKQQRVCSGEIRKNLQQLRLVYESCELPGHIADGADIGGRLCGVSSSVIV